MWTQEGATLPPETSGNGRQVESAPWASERLKLVRTNRKGLRICSSYFRCPPWQADVMRLPFGFRICESLVPNLPSLELRCPNLQNTLPKPLSRLLIAGYPRSLTGVKSFVPRHPSSSFLQIRRSMFDVQCSMFSGWTLVLDLWHLRSLGLLLLNQCSSVVQPLPSNSPPATKKRFEARSLIINGLRKSLFVRPSPPAILFRRFSGLFSLQSPDHQRLPAKPIRPLTNPYRDRKTTRLNSSH